MGHGRDEDDERHRVHGEHGIAPEVSREVAASVVERAKVWAVLVAADDAWNGHHDEELQERGGGVE